jgi:hypothetical protein
MRRIVSLRYFSWNFSRVWTTQLGLSVDKHWFFSWLLVLFVGRAICGIQGNETLRLDFREEWSGTVAKFKKMKRYLSVRYRTLRVVLGKKINGKNRLTFPWMPVPGFALVQSEGGRMGRGGVRVVA